jgi:transcriptional regulator with XRE-family HTH domain
MTVMSEAANERIPELTQGRRLRMALVQGRMSVQSMAEALEVSRATASRWMSDTGRPPRTVFIKQWALITGTDVQWLLTGYAPPSSPSSTPLDNLQGMVAKPDWVNTPVAAHMLGLSLRSIQRFAEDGTLPPVMRVTDSPNGAYLFERADIERLAEARSRAKTRDGHPTLGLDVDDNVAQPA